MSLCGRRADKIPMQCLHVNFVAECIGSCKAPGTWDSGWWYRLKCKLCTVTSRLEFIDLRFYSHVSLVCLDNFLCFFLLVNVFPILYVFFLIKMRLLCLTCLLVGLGVMKFSCLFVYCLKGADQCHQLSRSGGIFVTQKLGVRVLGKCVQFRLS